MNANVSSFLNENVVGATTTNYSYYWPALLLTSFSFIGIIGNLLVCLAIATEKKLQNITNWFLFSLALADMLVSGLVIPLAIVKEFTGLWILGPLICDLWIFLDVCSCTSSIMHIVVISIDRYLAIEDPLNARNRNRKCKIWGLIILVWFIAIFLSSPIIFLGIINPNNVIVNGQCLLNNNIFIIYGSVVAFVIPLCIVIVMYTLTVNRLKKQIKQCQTQLANEQLARAASLVARPFLRRHIPIATTTKTQTYIPMKKLNNSIRRTRLKNANQCSIETDNNSDNELTKPIVDINNSTSTTHRRILKLVENSLPQSSDDSEEDLTDVNQTNTISISPTSSFRQRTHSPHAEYSQCPKNPFCQLKCTCQHHHQQQQQQQQQQLQQVEKQKLIETGGTTPSLTTNQTEQSKSFINFFKHVRQCMHGSNVDERQQLQLRTAKPFNGQPSLKRRRLRQRPYNISSRSKSSAVRNEQKAVKVLGVVFVIFVIAWFPFCIMNLLQAVCKKCLINIQIINILSWLGYVSSTINPLVYTIFNRNFRIKFIQLLKFQCYSTTNLYYLHHNQHTSRLQRKNCLIINDIKRFNKQYQTETQQSPQTKLSMPSNI
ncbi:unnamed protein product [Didymodactylos carnosus]|uniref:G-protein coupled receptors family 1 profile domain-containing protein n=1 Tax=Didymodactylos carnosus TaxID=1234261 RepID=A0A8S2CTE1_9BILA|nr:unnamed protein product [Didymodactylos carnosus]CAF3537468.1 unnamed protein product [Didymodactylos carnosus]